MIADHGSVQIQEAAKAGRSRILLVDPDPAGRGSVESMLAGHDAAAFELDWAGSLLACLDTLARSPVDVILLDLFLPDSRGLATYSAVRLHAPDVPILIWSALDSQSLALTAVNSGAEDYLIKDRLNPAALVRALLYAVARHGNRAGRATGADMPKAPVLGFLGAKGGVGVTTLVGHLALELRKQTSKPVLVADLDLYSGLLAFLFQVRSQYHVLDAATNLHRLDLDCWKAMVTPCADGVDLIASPGKAGLVDAPPVERVRHVIRFLRTHYGWILLDLGRVSPTSLLLAREVNELYIETTYEAGAFYQLRKLLEMTREIPGPECCRVIVNRLPRTAEAGMQDLEALAGVRPYATLPSHYRELEDSSMSGRLLPDSSVLRKRIAILAAQIAGAEPALKRKQGVLGWLLPSPAPARSTP